MASPPPSPSPNSSTSSLHEDTPILERLVTHFVASKRSLTSTNLVWRANEIVTTAREALEENAVLSAKNSFVRKAVEEQLCALEAVRQGVELVGEEGHAEFKITIASLDISSTRLNETLTLLRSTSVEPSFQPASSEPKQLFDFVESSGIDELHDSIRASIDRFNSARESLGSVCDAFGADVENIYNTMDSASVRTDEAASVQMNNKDDVERQEFSPIPFLFRELENHATEMATNLQSLVQHYDLCITALKHTEGGGEAAQHAVQEATGELDEQELPTGLGVELESLDQGATPQPMSEEERSEMLAVLNRDATEVEDVVAEIGERLADMEDQLLEVTSYVERLRIQSENLRKSLKLLDRSIKQVPDYIAASNQFLVKWEEEKVELSGKMEELEGLKDFYDTFLSAYDGLIIEVSRRRAVRRKTEKVLKEAMAKINQLYQDDIEEREAFQADHGEYLPRDIWPALTAPLQRYEVRRVSGVDEQAEGDESAGAESIPAVRKETLEKALQRQNTRV